jgi:catechol 2,3-dioxygenase-like lactoylglutathione lyase family enzyme
MKTTHLLSINGLHHVSLRVRGMDKSLSFYLDVRGFLPKTAFLLDGLRFAMFETRNNIYIELVEMNQRCTRLERAKCSGIWRCRTDHLEKIARRRH